jgi:hypothetical protein
MGDVFEQADYLPFCGTPANIRRFNEVFYQLVRTPNFTLFRDEVEWQREKAVHTRLNLFVAHVNCLSGARHILFDLYFWRRCFHHHK